MRSAWLLLFASGCVSDVPAMMDSGGADTSTADTSTADAPPGDAGTSFCTGKPFAFCADFDLVPMVDTGWSVGKVEKNGTVAHEQTTYVSPPLSMSSRLPPIVNGVAYDHSAQLSHVLQLNGKTKSRLTYDVNPKAPPGFLGGECLGYGSLAVNGIGGIIIMQRRTQPDAGASEWLVYRSLTSTSAPHFMSVGLALGKWSHVVQDVTWATDTSGAIRITIDGNVALDVSGVPTTQETTLQTVRVNVGLVNCTGTSQNAVAVYDNVFAELL